MSPAAKAPTASTDAAAASGYLSQRRRPLDALAYGLMLVLCLIWGFQQVAIKLTLTDMAPVMQLATRFAGAAVVFAVLVLQREGRRAFADGTLAGGILVGLLFAGEFLLIAESLRHTSAAHSVVLLYTAPVFSALGLQFLPEERLSPLQWAGIAIAITGIAVAFLGHDASAGGEGLLGDVLALLGGVLWGVSTVVLRRSRLAAAAATKTVLYQVLIASLVLGAYAFASGQAAVLLTPRLALSLAFQTLGIAVLSYLGWFWLLRHYLTSRLMLLAIMTPLFGVVFGALLLSEAIDPRFALGTACVIAGIAVVNGAPLWRGARR